MPTDMSYSMRIWLAISALAIAGSANAADQRQITVVSLSYGITTLDLTGGGLPSMAVFARRENFNAHGFDVLTLYVNASYGDGSPPVWQLVPVFDKNQERLTVSVSGGADCLLHDFRLIALAKPLGLRLVVADREMGKSYAGVAPVTFRFYELKRNAENLPGWPLYYFDLKRSQRAKRRYCDVGDAFGRELGLGQYMERAR